MKKFIVAAVAAVALGFGLGGAAEAGYKKVVTRTTVEAKVVKTQATQVVAVTDGYGHAAVAVKKATATAVAVQVKKSTLVVNGGY